MASLIARLENSDYSSLRNDFFEYLQPFSDYIDIDFDFDSTNNAKKEKKKKKKKKAKKIIATDPKLMFYPLANRFMQFLGKAIRLLPRRLNELQRLSGGKKEEVALELFDVYKLCVACLTCISPCLDNQSFLVHDQRAKLLQCYVSWGRYLDAEQEGFQILEYLRSSSSASSLSEKKKMSMEENFLPELEGEHEDPELALLVVDIVDCLVKCSFKSPRKEEVVYQKVASLVNHVGPWFSVLDSDTSKKCHLKLATSLYNCTMFILNDNVCVEGDLVHMFCMKTLTHYLKSSMIDKFLKVAQDICLSLGSRWSSRSSLIIDILKCVLDLVACECKFGVKDIVNEVFNIIPSCLRGHQLASTGSCRDVAQNLERKANNFLKVVTPIYSVLRLYAAGLCVTESSFQQSCTGSERSFAELLITLSVRSGNDILYGTDVLSSLACYFHGASDNCGSLESSISCKREHGKLSFMSYLNALAFFCHPFAILVTEAIKPVHIGKKSATDSPIMKSATDSPIMIYIQDAFHQCCDAFLVHFGCTSERRRDEFKQNRNTLYTIAVAALVLSIRTDKNVKKSVDHVVCILSSCWIRLDEMKRVVSVLHNVGVKFYNDNQRKQASDVFKLCCSSAWRCIENLEANHIDWSEEAISYFVTQACSKCSILLGALHACGTSDLRSSVKTTLANWAIKMNSYENLNCPVELVRKWVKIMCDDYKNLDAVDDAPTLHSLLCEYPRKKESCAPFSERTIGILLEQELLAYEEMEALNVNLCRRVQLKITEILLRDVYVTKDLQRSKTLIKSGRLLRVRGIGDLKSCIGCLSEAISILSIKQNGVYDESSPDRSLIFHQLALACCLRALCSQEEAQPNTKVIMSDIYCALKLWLSIDWSMDVHYDMVTENITQLLICVSDLLSIKGHFNFQYDLYKLIIIFLKRKSVSLEKCFAMLWADRRLTHGLCTKPMDEGVISSFVQYFGAFSGTVGFWVSCIQDSQALLVGFHQRFSLYDSILAQGGQCIPQGHLSSNITVNEVEEAASALDLSVHKNNSNFLVGHLYYDLSERFISRGQLIEALSYSRKAFRLRSNLLKKKFICTSLNPQYTSETGGTTLQNESVFLEVEVLGSVAAEVWPCKGSWTLKQCNLSQWNLLQCYLESTLQVAYILEALGDCDVAKTFLVRGKNISSKKGLPIFEVAFASALGKMYCKERVWDFAETELNSAKQALVDNSRTITCKQCKFSLLSCKQCKLTLEATIDKRFGDLMRNRSDGAKTDSLDNSSAALDLYRTALDTLKHFEWNSNPEPTLRMTRSRSRSSCNRKVKVRGEVKSRCLKISSENNVFRWPSTHSWMEPHWKVDRPSGAESGCAKIFVCNGTKCWKCLLVKVMENDNMQEIINMKWEFHRKRLSLRLLNEIGRCIGEQGDVCETHEILWECVTMLFDRKEFIETYSGQHSPLPKLTVKEREGDVFAVERAAILYNLCWFSLKNVRSRNTCCDLSCVQLRSMVSWLLQAFILCCEAPLLLQKVSKLLATVFSLSNSGKPFPQPLFPGKSILESRLAAFFHQASLGTYFGHQLCLPKSSASEGSQLTAPTKTSTEVFNSFRLALGSTTDLETFLFDFFRHLPSITVICVSLLGSEYASLLSEILPDPCSCPAWMLLSRLNSDNEPIVMLLPSDVIPEHIDPDARYSSFNGSTNSQKKWICPWGRTVVDDVAPEFKMILEENYVSSSVTSTYTQEECLQWWTWRSKLNKRLEKFVRCIEDSWFGPWKCLLLGEPLETCLGSGLSKLISGLRCKFDFAGNEYLLRVIFEGTPSVPQIEECISQLLKLEGCTTCCEYYPDKNYDSSSTACARDENLCEKLLHQLILEATYKTEAECISRKPIILVLDSDVQMLPWESLPVLRKQEVYRMPSLHSISVLINVNFYRQEEIGRSDWKFPSIDPLDAFYLLNPSGDLQSTQVEFEEWFRDQKMEGKAGGSPCVEELVLALKKHDLFIYFGHGDGKKYIPRKLIQKLETCAATLLMGCCSGSLYLFGCYNPGATVFSYLLAGSPAVIANLWEVTDKDIDRFAKSILAAWFRERSTTSINDCNGKLESMSIESKELDAAFLRRNPRRCDTDSHSSIKFKDTWPNIGSFMSQAREACTFPFLIGASPVCYGIPTGIRKKKGLYV